MGGGIVVNEAYECANFWRRNDSDERGCTNFSTKIAGSSTDRVVDQFKDFVERVSSSFTQVVSFCLPVGGGVSFRWCSV